MAKLSREQALPWLLLIVLSLVWGSSFILIKQGLLAFSPGEVGALRIVSAGLFLMPLALPKLKTLRRRQWGILFLIGLVGSFIPAFLFALAQTRIASGLAGVLNATTPIFTLIIGGIFFGTTIRTRSIIGIIIGFLGVTMLILSGENTNILENFNAYALFIIAATVCYGINVNVIKAKVSNLTSVTITGVSLFLVTPIAATYLFGFTDFLPKLSQVEGAYWSLGCLVLLGILGTALALVYFNRLVQLVSPVFAAQVTYLIPIVALLWGLAVDETILWGHVAGMLCILVGVYVANRK
ncbi:MAG: DMT family transporter [Bacteroidota bacterium]